MALNRLHRWLAMILLAAPAMIYLSILLAQQQSIATWEMVHKQTGYIALVLTILVFILNPVLASFPKFPIAAKVNRYRREIGVAAFGYVCIHFLAVVKFKLFERLYFDWIDFSFQLAGFIAFLIFLLLALTSNNYSVRKLGGKRWKQLHRMGYIAEGCIFIHLFLQGGSVALIALVAFTPLFVLQYVRRKKRLLRR